MEKIEGDKSVVLELNIYLSCIKATQAVCEQSYFFDHSSLGLERVNVKMMVKIIVEAPP